MPQEAASETVLVVVVVQCLAQRSPSSCLNHLSVPTPVLRAWQCAGVTLAGSAASSLSQQSVMVS